MKRNPSARVVAASIVGTLAVFFVGSASSFRVVVVPTGGGKPSSSSDALIEPPGSSIFSASSSSSKRPGSGSRRGFVADLLSSGAGIAAVVVSQASLLPRPAFAETVSADAVFTGTIKVTPIAHTFVTTGKSPSSPKPIRENDATRFFTNARVVYLFDGSADGSGAGLAREVTTLTKTRKEERGPGVTPGSVRTLTVTPDNNASAMVTRVVETAKQMTDGDVLLVGPVRSLGTRGDGEILASTASGLGTFVGGKQEKGVISVLLNGPRENLRMVASGFPISELLWYGLPTKG